MISLNLCLKNTSFARNERGWKGNCFWVHAGLKKGNVMAQIPKKIALCNEILKTTSFINSTVHTEY